MKRPIFKAVGKEEGKMNRKPEYIIADPSGNITAFVLTPTERQQYSFGGRADPFGNGRGTGRLCQIR